MGTYSETEEDSFFDIRDEISSLSDLGSDCSDACTRNEIVDCALGYEFWTQDPESVDERRNRFLKWMGLNSNSDRRDGLEMSDVCSDGSKTNADRIRSGNETVLANSDSEGNFFSGRSSQSNEALELEKDSVEDPMCWKIRNLDNGSEFVADEFGQDGMLSRLREVGTNRLFTIQEFQRNLGSSALIQQLLHRDIKGFNMVDTKSKIRSLLQKLTISTRHKERTKGVQSTTSEFNLKSGVRTQRVRVHSSKKESKELSSLYTGQEFLAHEGSIITMKFSPCGQYLASAGKDGTVRIWRVTEDDIPKDFKVQDIDPSCLYFSLNHLSKLVSLNDYKEKINGMKMMRKSSESACVVLPPKLFRIMEKPLHEFHGHTGEVLALSWSKNGYLLSSSVDKTARLWQVGNDKCLGVYSHNNYVTCVEFNPMDDNYFISGSIDGKIRLWDVHGYRVIDWTDVKEIVTAVCYCPDGKGGVVGYMDGNCRFYDVVGNRLQMGSKVSLQGKKKITNKRVTGFQYCPNDSSKVMVTSADSQVRILSGSNVICKFKGTQNLGSQCPASFTSDGKHILAVTEDSNVYIWNYSYEDGTTSQAKKVRSSESFLSQNASVTIPWCGFKTNPGTLPPGSVLANGDVNENSQPKTSSLQDCFSLGRASFLDSILKGSPTWPEEKLPDSSPANASPSISKSEYKILKSAWQSALSSSHLWGLVVVTAGWDGCIRTFLNYGLPLRL
ncbi:PREDICTED: WD repeat-containing protein 44-like [Nicotiana attenuata]|uniref:Compass-like h3k4 histone methylase component wdr5a n=1 Tax=Nicotiana attenuata TaxID=49451 RepID=A0A314LA88_NICAT|nr:PREDICTED: WD repeat-containing protein 44-like [Nicotiana attenuata]XP_019261446.1 PREDICTED: WD repeat-containing protein 44-like [Nicotiana attenuata]XP_019261447.1 PREDICTED: WD repeat-containing protein 44-like [Nicotiana attenuata]XP_019261448.1 PREDICTED: WD repeat-containing protein 44-like [Nicotiana attenuata]OIT38498.1 compass-like h3k4 histone methylase component wdr5a [Nicotiana attenuata]